MTGALMPRQQCSGRRTWTPGAVSVAVALLRYGVPPELVCRATGRSLAAVVALRAHFRVGDHPPSPRLLSDASPHDIVETPEPYVERLPRVACALIWLGSSLTLWAGIIWLARLAS
jgi:hypothetical protein